MREGVAFWMVFLILGALLWRWERFRGRGLGPYLVQELKRQAYDVGAIPAARCNRDNRPSRKTLQKAGFVSLRPRLTGAIDGLT